LVKRSKAFGSGEGRAMRIEAMREVEQDIDVFNWNFNFGFNFERVVGSLVKFTCAV
jgi:hypothetical protein